MKYFDNPDSTSPEDSLQGPFEELDLNVSDSFLKLSPKRSGKSNRQYSGITGKENRSRSKENKENLTGVDKLPVFHRGVYGEQEGTLIVRHHIQSDSKCIQCRNCGIFFNPSSFLKHCHDQYGKRAQCNASHLQLALDCPTSQQKDVWNSFQKKLGGERTEVTFAKPDSLAARHIRNLDRPKEDFIIPVEKSERAHPRTRRSSVEIPLRHETKDFRGPDLGVSRRRPDETLFRSRQYSSSTALNAPQPQESLSLSELRPERRSTRMTSSYGPSYERESRRTPYSGRIAGYESALPDRSDPRTRQYDYRSSAPTLSSHEPYRPATFSDFERPVQARPWETTNVSENTFQPPRPYLTNPTPAFRPSDDAMFTPFPEVRPIVETISKVRKSLEDLSESKMNKESSDGDAKDLIMQAISLLQSAAEKINRDKGQNSNAWRKMYEEERDHRMSLEAKVRELERERSRKT